MRFDYLETRKFAVTDANRKIIGDKLETYPGKPPIKRDELIAWLDGFYKK